MEFQAKALLRVRNVINVLSVVLDVCALTLKEESFDDFK